VAGVRGRAFAWLVTVPIALVGVALAHAVANAAFGSPAEAGELFASPASGSGLVPLLAAVAFALVLVGSTGATRVGSVALPFAALPPVAFVALESFEALEHDAPLLGKTFGLGLILQLPFALAGYLLARVLLRAAQALRRFVRARPPRAAGAAPRQLLSLVEERPSLAPLHSCSRGRAPPVVSLASP
jgi:hypothetical protein